MPMDIKELVSNDAKDDDYSSDSDQEMKKNRKLTFSKNQAATASDNQLKAILTEINNKLENDETIDLSQYPPLFIVHYRGTHFFEQFFSQVARQNTRHKIKGNEFKESIYSAAIYDLAELKMCEPIDTRAKIIKIRQAKKKLQQGFEKLSAKKSTEAAWWGGKDREHEKLIHQHYQRYVNNYKEFRDESEEASHKCYTILASKKTPYISSADGARHAVLYAMGAKSELSHGSLRPAYSKNGRARRPKIGYVQIIFHRLEDLARHNPIFLSVLQAENKVDIKDRTLNERETTYKGWVTAKHVAHTQTVRFPSFNIEFSARYHPNKYGINKKSSFSRYKNMFEQQSGNTTLVDKLADHYAEQLENEARRIAEEKKGFIVYLGLDGRLHQQLPTTADVRNVRGKNRNGLNNHSMFNANLAKYQSKNNRDTDTEEEFPDLPKKEDKAEYPIWTYEKKEILTEKIINYSYWYSMEDGYRLLIAIRKKNLFYEKFIRGGEHYCSLRENSSRILITDPYYIDFFENSFIDDIKSITGTHETNEKNTFRWEKMPTILIIPFLAGCHWRAIRVEIDYIKKSVNILWDDPFGGKYFTEQLIKIIKPSLKDGIYLLFDQTSKKPVSVHLSQIHKEVDQQGLGVNGADCGPIIFSNVRDYATNLHNQQFSAINANKFSINAANTSNHKEIIMLCREQDAEHYSSIQNNEKKSTTDILDEKEDLSYTRILELNKKIAERQKTNLNNAKSTTQSLVDKLSNELTTQKISKVFDFIDNQRVITGKKLDFPYDQEELESAYQMVKSMKERTEEKKSEPISSGLENKFTFFGSSSSTKQNSLPKIDISVPNSTWKDIESWYLRYEDIDDVVSAYEDRYGTDTFDSDHCLSYNSRKSRLVEAGRDSASYHLQSSLHNRIADFIENKMPANLVDQLPKTLIFEIDQTIPDGDWASINGWYSYYDDQPQKEREEFVGLYDIIFGKNSFSIDHFVSYNGYKTNLRDMQRSEVDAICRCLAEKICQFLLAISNIPIESISKTSVNGPGIK